MKKYLFIIVGLILITSASVYAQSEVTDDYVQHIITTGRQYIIAILKNGPNRSMSDDSVENEQMQHLRYLFTLRQEGKLPIYGPFYNSGDLAGFCIFNSTNEEEVKTLMDADPHVKSGYLVYELHSWYGIPGDSLPK